MRAVFLSYARKDEAFVKRLCKDLDRHSLRYWLDRKDIRVGQSISKEVENAIRRADYVCLCLSSISVRRQWVQREYRAALNLQLSRHPPKPIICPILVNDCTVPVLLRDIRHARFTPSYSTGLQDLLRALGVKFKPPAPYQSFFDHLETFHPAEDFLEETRQLETLEADCTEPGEAHGAHLTLEGEWAREFVSSLTEGIETTKAELEAAIVARSAFTLVDEGNPEPGGGVQVLLGQFLYVHDDTYKGRRSKGPFRLPKRSTCDYVRLLIRNRSRILCRELYVLPVEFSWSIPSPLDP